MNYKTQNSLLVVASGVIFGAAGFWLVPQAKGAVVGSAAGVAAAAGHVSKDKRLRQIAARQQEVNSTRQTNVQNLKDLIFQTAKVTESVSHTTQENEAKIDEIREALPAIPDSQHAELNELHDIKVQLKAVDSKLARHSAASAQIEDIKLALRKLENKVNSLQPQANGAPRIESPPTRSATEVFEESQEDEETQTIIEWFQEKEIEVENYYEPDPKIDTILDELSLYLGDNYSVLKRFHRKLRSSVGRRTQFSLADYDSRAKSIHNQYRKKLISSDYLRHGKLVKPQGGNDFISVASYDRADVKGFFDGGWFERFIYDKVIELFDSEGIDYQYLRNPKIAYSNGDLSELDLFFLANGQPLLIECKAGQHYHEGIEKFNAHRKKLGLDASNAFFVVLDIDEAEANIRNYNWDLTVADQNNFIVRIKEIIASYPESQKEPDEDDTNELALEQTENDSLESFFKKQSLNLAPEYRNAAFEALISVMNSLEEPESFNEIAKKVRDSVEALSRKKANEILSCLRHSGMFTNQNNSPVRNVAKPIYGMSSLETAMFEEKCMEFYAKKVIRQLDPEFFDTEDNVALFERLTHGTAPSDEKIQQMKDNIPD